MQYHGGLLSRELGQAPMILVCLTPRQALSSHPHQQMVWPTAAHRWHFVLRDVSWFTVYSIADLLTSSHPHLSASNLLGLQGPQQTLASLEIIKITAIARFRYAYVYIMNVGKWEFGTVHRILEASLNLMAEIQILTFFHQSFLVASILYSRVTTPSPSFTNFEFFCIFVM